MKFESPIEMKAREECLAGVGGPQGAAENTPLTNRETLVPNGIY
jgi:hypothetical protein